jgi:hypothetical protein
VTIVLRASLALVDAWPCAVQHGGGKRCFYDGCTKSARGSSGLCIAHGGGPRCTYPSCSKSARTVGGYCKAVSVRRQEGGSGAERS